MLMMISFFVALGAYAQSCPVTTNAPACPTSGVRILDDRYPTQAFVISTDPYNPDSSSGRALPGRTIFAAMNAYDFHLPTMPMMMVPTTAEEFESLKKDIEGNFIRSGKTADEAHRFIDARVKHIEAEAYTWQQDFYEATFDTTTGTGKLNYSSVYEQRSPKTRSTVRSMGATGICGISSGPDLISSIVPATNENRIAQLTNEMGTTPTASGEFGGNMEGLPGGLCLVGDNMMQSFANQICGSEANTVKIESNWLEVGHVDEIMKVLPDHSSVKGRPSECAFTIATADTELGLSLLKNPSSLNRSVIELDIDQNLKDARGVDLLHKGTYGSLYSRTLNSTPTGKMLCDIVNDPARSRNQESSGAGGAKSAWYRSLIPLAYAETEAEIITARVIRQRETCAANANSVTANEFVSKIESSEGLVDYNLRIQDALKRGRKKVFDSILARLPQCRPFFPTEDSMFTKVPNYFAPKDYKEAGTHIKLGKAQAGYGAFSFFPNPTNGVLMNKTLLLPGPLPGPYAEYMRSALASKGLKPAGLDTWDYAHSGQGNLHCSSHSIPYCRPGGQR